MLSRNEEISRGAADQHIDRAQLGPGFCHRGFECRHFANICHSCADLCPESPQFNRRIVEFLLSAATYGDIGTQRREILGDTEINAAAATGNEDGLTLEEFTGKIRSDIHVDS